jgi:hypothetical protein
MNYSNEDFHQNSKQSRRENLKHKKKNREEIPDAYRAQNKLNKEFKSKKQSMYEDELWEDWEDFYKA